MAASKKRKNLFSSSAGTTKMDLDSPIPLQPHPEKSILSANTKAGVSKPSSKST
ncbi:MAG: hypothetical protein Q9201_007327, partial [Fulgogasparrea decipioides]